MVIAVFDEWNHVELVTNCISENKSAACTSKRFQLASCILTIGVRDDIPHPAACPQ